MSEVFIPLGGAGGKNRGTAAVLGDSTPFSNAGAVMSLPLPAGNYKKSVSNPRTNYGDGKNSEVTISKELLKKMAIEAFGIASITNFSATMYAHKQVRLTWARPTKGLWSGTFFVFKKGRMPNSVYDSDTQYASGDTHLVTQPLPEGVWYIRAFNYVATNNGRWYDDGKVSFMINVTGISGSVTFGAGAGTWIVPEGVRRIRYILVGHGGKGGGNASVGAAGGGGGGYFTTGYMDVTPGQQIPWVVPIVNSFVYNNGFGFNAGFNTKLGNISVECGRASNNDASYDAPSEGGNGGSGGGGSFLNGLGAGAPGGSNGSDGVQGSNTSRRGNASYARGGTGQHTSTLGFNGVLYSGGGGGGGADGGAGGGGNGWKYDKNQRFQIGADGTDGLGGGGGGGKDRGSKGGKGGTGCIYIAWGSSMNDGS
jgi:hypothetical protein|nr:MAG TPA: hypothetical protein [Caudoviricetes sp.]